jgi:hypothetical protein
MLYSAVQYNTVQMLYSAVQYNTVQMLYSAVQYNTVQMQYSAVQQCSQSSAPIEHASTTNQADSTPISTYRATACRRMFRVEGPLTRSRVLESESLA